MAVGEKLIAVSGPPTSTNSATRFEIASRFFPSPELSLSRDQFRSKFHELDTYFTDWFEEQSELYRPLLDPQVKTVEDVLQIVHFLQQNGDATRAELLAKCSLSSGRHPANISLTFAASLWFSISFDQIYPIVKPGRYLEWDNASSLRQAIGSFPPPPVLSDNVRLPKSFTAVNIEQMAGIKIQWTSNLADHLSLKDDDTRLTLYHQASFLELHKQCSRYQ